VVLLSIIAGIGALVAGGCRQDVPPPVPAPLRLSLAPLDELAGARANHSLGLALAPDGRRVAFPAAHDGGAQLWVHDLSAHATTALPGTDNAAMPFWSPDAASIAYFADGRLRAYSLADQRVTDLAGAVMPRGGAWHSSGDIIFAADDSGLKWRRASGVIEPLTTVDPGESSHRFPHLTADGRHIVFFVRASESTRHGIWIAPLDQPAARRRLINSDAEGLPLERALLYSSGGALVAQRMNLEPLGLEGRPVLLGQSVGHSPEHRLFATVGADVLMFGTPASTLRELRWVDRAGAPTGVLGEPMEAWDMRIAPNAATVAVARVDPQLDTLDIWAYDGQRPLPRRVSPNIDVDEAPVWSRDGSRIAWVSSRRVVTSRDARAAQPEASLRKFDLPVRVTDWPDEWIVVTASSRETRDDVLLIRPDGAGDTRAYVQSAFNEDHGVVSPDGKWMAYSSDESGRAEVYADAFPSPGRRARLTVGGGTEPRWSRDGSELFFRRGSTIHAVRLRASGAALEAASSEQLFDAGADIRSFDVTAGGTRFLINVPTPAAAPRPLSVIVNVSSLLAR
jgi:Tol biopolymer transport system component